MYSVRNMLRPFYTQSRALLIGINQYQNVNPLSFAVNDALGVKECLIEELGFSEDHIKVLQDVEATKENILREYMKLTSLAVEADERIIMFFAGHGETISGISGEVGFLVPVDASPNDLSTMIRWNELTSNAELIRAKHMLFIMDACYGGLAINRSIGAGATRYLQDLLCRISRQVITAGKADQTVSDEGGELPGHSIFTSHLIEGLRGRAENDQGIITANTLLSYVSEKVGNAPHSRQTPHYGQFYGDGDVILKAPQLTMDRVEAGISQKTLVTIPHSVFDREEEQREDQVEKVKKLLADPTSHIELHDLMTINSKRFLEATSEDFFPLNKSVSEDLIIAQIADYEEKTEPLWRLLSLISRWGGKEHFKLVQNVISRSCDRLKADSGGYELLLGLRWYPLGLVIYSCGISAIAHDNYLMLNALFEAKAGVDSQNNRQLTALEAFCRNFDERSKKEIFKVMAKNTNYHFPFSEHLFGLLQPNLDDLHFIGSDYEWLFNRLEVLIFLAANHAGRRDDINVYGGYGRFAYKEKRYGSQPLSELIAEATRLKDDWEPLKQGMFGGSFETFIEVANEGKETVDRLRLF